MDVVIAGGHGKIALALTRLLAARGDRVTALVRNPDHYADVRAAGAAPVLCDLEAASVRAVAAHLGGADAVVFAAGAGPGSGAARKDSMDRAGAVLVAEAALLADTRRHVQISAMGLDRADRPGLDEVFATYLRAKAAAEDHLRATGLDWTILRPGRLTDRPAAGRVRLGEHVPAGEVARADVAAVVAALLGEPAAVRRTLELVGGDIPVAEAVAGLSDVR